MKNNMEKSERELLKETLQKSSEEYNSLPNWLKNSISTKNIFNPKPIHKPAQESKTLKDWERLNGLKPKDSDFEKHLENASKIVKSWPEWKQNVIGKINT